MVNFDDCTNENKPKHNQKWLSYRMLLIGRSGCGKANALLNLINNQSDIDQIYLYSKDLYKTKY